MTAEIRYLDALQRLLEDVAGRAEDLEVLAHRVADSIRAGGVLHVFGTGHSQLVAQELAERAGGLAAVNAIVVPSLSPVEGQRAAAAEQLAGSGQRIVDEEDLRAGEVLVVISHSGINRVPIEVAQAASERGLFVVAVTSRAHSLSVPARHPDGLRLVDVADLTLDTGAPRGDAAVELPNGAATGPVSTVIASAALHAVMARTAELLSATGATPPVLVSQNLPDHDANAPLFARYAARTGRWP